MNAKAQVNADLELLVVYPENSQVIPFGDSVQIVLSVINHGPDDIINDTIFIDNNVIFGTGFIGDIPAGDTVTAYGITQWMNDGETSNDTMNICYYFRSPVSITSNVIDTNASNDTACVSYVLLGDSTTGIATSKANQTIKLFPNLAKDLVQIGMNTSGYHKLQLSVIDIYGREVFFQDYEKKSMDYNNNIWFDVTGFQPGIYFVRLLADDKTFTNKLVVR